MDASSDQYTDAHSNLPLDSQVDSDNEITKCFRLKDGKYFYKTKFSVKRAAYNLGPKSKVSPVIKIIAALTLKQ